MILVTAQAIFVVFSNHQEGNPDPWPSCPLPNRPESHYYDLSEDNIHEGQFKVSSILPGGPWPRNTGHIQDVPGEKVNILGGHSINRSKQKSIYIRMSYSERFLRESYFTVQYTVYCTEEQHAMSSYELQSALMLTEFSKMYYIRQTVPTLSLEQ
jgi:hypothetical protein